ncbi:hypothetical protein BH23PAT2_BH23PAT2_10330 [soil metagenome]
MKRLTAVSEFRLKLYPKDFHSVRRFYEEELGYDAIHDWDKSASKGVMFNIGTATLELLWPDPHGYDAAKSADVSWAVTDVQELFEAMKDKQYITGGLVDNSWGDTSFHIQDPEGFRITFFTKTK